MLQQSFLGYILNDAATLYVNQLLPNGLIFFVQVSAFNPRKPHFFISNFFPVIVSKPNGHIWPKMTNFEIAAKIVIFDENGFYRSQKIFIDVI